MGEELASWIHTNCGSLQPRTTRSGSGMAEKWGPNSAQSHSSVQLETSHLIPTATRSWNTMDYFGWSSTQAMRKCSPQLQFRL